MTQKQRLGKWIIERGEIDPLTAWRELGIYRLSARINELRQTMSIKTERKTIKNQFGEPVTVANYKTS